MRPWRNAGRAGLSGLLKDRPISILALAPPASRTRPPLRRYWKGRGAWWWIWTVRQSANGKPEVLNPFFVAACAMDAIPRD